MEDAVDFEKKVIEIKAEMTLEDMKEWISIHAPQLKQFQTPACLDYSSQLPHYHHRINGSWLCRSSLHFKRMAGIQELFGLKDKLSREYLCEKLKARHTKSETAVNVCVTVSVWDVLHVVKHHGLPTCKQYQSYEEILKSNMRIQRKDWIREAKCRFETSCAKHRFDKSVFSSKIWKLN